MKSLKLTSVFDIPEIEEDELDYQTLYEKQKKMRVFYERKTKELQTKLRIQIKDIPQRLRYNKPPRVEDMIEDIKSFKSLLPNSVKQIPELNSDQSIADNHVPPLVKQWAIYGLSQQALPQMQENTQNHGNTLSSNRYPSQILEHSARLVFPSGTSIRKLRGKQALQSSLDIMNLSKQKLKSFILAFEPTSIQRKKDSSQQGISKQLQILNILNPEGRIYAICIEMEEFTILNEEVSMIEMKTHRKNNTKKQAKSVKFQDMQSEKEVKILQIAVSKRVYCIFSHYPFFGFFQELLKSVLYAVKVERYIRFKEGGQSLKVVDSRPHAHLIKSALQELKKESATKNIITDKLLDFSVCGNNKAYLQLNKQALTYNLAEEWAYYILSLFTLDIFLDLFTLIALQQKIVFVCSNATILTHAIYLFTKVLIKPFDYPYPVVNLIPDQEEYLNAPFPVVYGYLKTRQEIMAAKIPKRFKNVYVFFQPTGVEIVSEQDKKKVLMKKSPRLRDRLISKFKKMQRNYPSTSFFSSFMSKKSVDFQYPVNIELSREILGQVYSYIWNDIFQLLPDDQAVEAIKKQLVSQHAIEQEDVNRQTFLRIKQDYSSKSKDPFFGAFLETQLLNVHIFKY